MDGSPKSPDNQTRFQDDEEEKDPRSTFDSREEKPERLENYIENDNRALLEFKRKYQQSLEAIQSFQEILELKKNYRTIHHSYNPIRKKESQSLSHSASKVKLQTGPNISPLTPKLEPLFHLNFERIQNTHVPQYSSNQTVRTEDPLKLDSSRASQTFRIKDSTLRSSRSIPSLKSALRSPEKGPKLPQIMGNKETPSASEAVSIFSPSIRSPDSVRQPFTQTQSTFNTPRRIEKMSADYGGDQTPGLMTDRTGYRSAIQLKPIEYTKMDEIMGEPYVKIKIRNLGNFRVEPLEVYDQALTYKEEVPAGLLKEGIDRGFSRYVNKKGETEWKECEILDYLEEENKFLIRWRHDGGIKKVTRLNLRYALEPEEKFDQRVEKAMETRYKNLYMGSYKEMLQEKARGDSWLNYPYDSLNKIIKLAFGRFANTEESDTPMMLVDELMDHYKQEIIRFSLEIRSFQSDFSAYVKKFTGAYREMKNIPIKNQDKAIEIVNMPYKEYREYKDWGDNVIIDKEEMDRVELLVLNDPRSLKVYYESLSRNSKLKAIQPSESLVKAYGALEFHNFLTIDESRAPFRMKREKVTYSGSPVPTEEDIVIKRESDLNAYRSRAVLKRKIRLVNVKKTKGDTTIIGLHKKGERNMSAVIAAFKQSFTKVLPKPPNFISQFLVMVSSLLRQLSDIKLFQAIIAFKSHHIARSLDAFKTIREDLSGDINKVELYIYRVQQCVDELKADIKVLKNDVQEKESLRRVSDFCTVMAHDSAKICIRESLGDLINSFEEYYAFLPLPMISDEVQKMLPSDVLEKRKLYREKLALSPDQFQEDITQNEKEGSPEHMHSARTGTKNDKELMQAVIICIMNDIVKGGSFFREGFINFDALRIKPMFLIKYLVKSNVKNSPQKHKIKMTRQDRARQRMTSRENIYQFETFKERLLADQYRGDEIPEIVRTSAEMNEKYVGKTLFNWFKLGRGGMITHEPHIYDIEEQLKKLIMSVFDVFLKLERIEIKPPPNDTFITIEGLEDDLLSFRSRLDEVFKLGLLPVLAIFRILNNLEFLLTQEKHYVSDIKDTFEDSPDNNIGIICQEIQELQADLDFVSTRLPRSFSLGFFLLDISEYIEKLKAKINIYMNNLKDFLQLKLNEVLTLNRDIVEKIEERLSKGAAVIDDYIELKMFLESKELQFDLKNISEGVELSEQITNYIEIFSMDYDPDVLDTFYTSKGWINGLNRSKRNAEVQLEAARPRLTAELKQKNEEMFKELEGIKIDIGNYANHYDVNNALQYYTNARFIMGKLDELMEYGVKCNIYEEMLVARRTDFAQVGLVKENFEKFYWLWEFIYDKWMMKCDSWLNSPFEALEIPEMEEVIQEGLRLLNVLEDSFRNNINILELVRTYLREVHRYKDYLDLLKKLKSETFKPRHWEMLWNEMYASVGTKPDQKTVTLKKLLEDKLFTYSSLINTLYKNAQDEYNIEQEIEKIEESLKKIKDLKTDAYEMGNHNTIYILKGISQVLLKLNDHHFVIKNMLANPNYPRAFLDKLNNLEYVIRGIKKILRLSDKVQKKFFIIAPIMRHRFINHFFGKDRDHSATYSSIQSQFVQQIEGIVRKKMGYLISLFDKTITADIPDLKHEVNGEDVIENLQKVLVKCDTIISDLYIVLKMARQSCPRLHILTDSHIIEYLSVVAEPKEVIKDLSWVFTGVKELKVEVPLKHPLIISGVVNASNETLTFTTKVVLNPQEQDGSHFFLCTLLNDIEKEIKRAVKDNLIKNLPAFFSNAYDYRSNFKLVKDRNLLFQLLVLLNNMLFYHDLSMVIASREHLHEGSAKEEFVESRLNMFKANIENNLAILCEDLAYEKDRSLFMLLNQFILFIKHQVDTLNYLIEADIRSLDSFEYLVLPKAMFEYHSKAIKNPQFMENSVLASKTFLEAMPSIQDYNQLNAKSEYLHLYTTSDTSSYNVVFRSFNYRRNYGFDLVPFTEPTVFTPSTNRSYVTILGALATQTGVLVNGLQDRGKKETIKGLAYMLGKEMFTIDQYSANYDFLTQLIFGAVKGSFWIVLDNIQEYANTVLSTVAQQIHAVRNALASGETRIKHGSLYFDMKGDQNWGLFATFSSTQADKSKSFESIPKNFIENFRVLNYMNPHLSHIIATYFELFGLQNPLQTANKVVTFFQVLLNAAENQLFFISENMSMEDIELVQALNIRPSMSLINKMIKSLQQMIISQSVLRIDIPEIWKAIKEGITSVAKERVMKLLLNLFNAVFQSDINEARDQITELSFKELLENNGIEHHTSGSPEFEKRCQQLFTTMNITTSRYKTILLTGRPGRGKTSIIETVAEIITKSQQRNFCLNWIDLDSTPSLVILGGKHGNNRLQGLIPVLIDIAVNDMSQAEMKANEYTSLVSHCTRWANPTASPKELPQNRLYNWIVLEGAYDQLHSETMDLVERLLAGKRQGMITALDGLKIRIPRTMSFIIECDKMTALNPANLSDVSIINLESNCFSLSQEYNRRVNILSKLSEFFSNVQPLLAVLFTQIIEPVINNTHQEYTRKGLIYYLSSTYVLVNFMNVFEILLNECRKVEISFGNITDNELERSEAQFAAKIATQQPQLDDKKIPRLNVVSKGDILGIRHSMRLEAPPVTTPGAERHELMIESSCIFALIWTVGTLYRPETRRNFGKTLLDSVRNYYKDSPLHHHHPPNPGFFLQFFKQKQATSSMGVFDYCLNIQTQSWVLWKSLVLPDYQEISGDFSSIRLPTKEIGKFNPLLKRSVHTKSFMDSSFMRTHLPTSHDQIFVQTSSSTKLMYFLDYLIAYKKVVVVLSEYESGKTTVINKKMRLLLEHNIYKTFSFSITPFATREQLSKNIQNSLVKTSKGGYSVPVDMEGLIFIDDLHLSSIEHRPWSLLQSFYNSKGWYSATKGTFIRLDRVSFLTASSHSFLKTQNVFKETFSNLPHAFLHKMLLFYMPEMSSEDLKMIFKEYSEPFLTEAEGKPYFKPFKNYLNHFLVFNFRNKAHMKALSNVLGCNFTLANTLQMFKTLQLWEWANDMSVQNLTDVWFFSLKRLYANQFGKVRALPDEFLLDIEDLEAGRSRTSSIASYTMHFDYNENERNRASPDSAPASKTIFEDPLKPARDEKRRKSKSIMSEDRKDSISSLGEMIASRRPSYQYPITLGQIEEGVESLEKIQSKMELQEKTDTTGTVKETAGKLEEIKETVSSQSHTNTQSQSQSSFAKTISDTQTMEVGGEKKPLLYLHPVAEIPESAQEGSVVAPNVKPASINLLAKPRKPSIRIDFAAIKRPSIEENLFMADLQNQIKTTRSEEFEIAPRRPSIAAHLDDDTPGSNRNARLNQHGSLSIPTESDHMEFLKPEATTVGTRTLRPEAKKQSQFSAYANKKTSRVSENFPGTGSRRKSGFSKTSIDQEVVSDSSSISEESAHSIASSASDEEINTLEKQLDIDTNEDLAGFPYESLNIISKILIFSHTSQNKNKKDYKVTDGVARDQSFAFNMELLNVGRHELNSEGFTPIFQLVSNKDDQRKKDIMTHIQTQIADHLPDNKPAIFYFNNFTFRFSSLLPHLSSLLLELQTPHQNIFLTSMSQPLYCYHALKFASHLLAYRVATFYLTPKKAANADVHAQFLTLLHDTISLSAHEGRKCVFALVLDGFKPKGVDLSNNLFTSMVNILQDMNAVILGASLKSILPKHQLKTLLTVLKKSDTYGHFPESHLLYILTQIVQTNVKFVIIAEEEALQLNSLTFRFEKDPEKLSLIELFLKFFPQSYVKFRKVVLNDLQLSIDRKLIFTEDIFPLDLDEDLCVLFQNSYNYEVQLGSIQDKEYGYSVLSNFRVAVLMADFVYCELKANLIAKSEAQKGTGHSLVGSVKKLRKRAEMMSGDVRDLMKFVQERKEEIEHIEENINNFKRKKEELSAEINEINKQLAKLEEDLKGFDKEEAMLKKLQGAFGEVTNALINYNPKEFSEDIKYSKFLNSKFFTLYAILWCYIFNIKVEEEKVSSEVDISNVNIGVLKPEIVSAYAKEFAKVLSDFNQLKAKILSFKFSKMLKDNLGKMIDIITDNNLTTVNVKFSKLQMNLIKWVDLAIETSKFELGKDSRIKEVKNIKHFVERLLQDLDERRQLIMQIDVALHEQPKLQAQILERITLTEKSILNLESTGNKMMLLSHHLEVIIKANYELNNPIAANRTLYLQYILATSLYMVQCAKYSAKIRSYLFKLTLNNMSSQLNFNVHKLHHVLYGKGFLVDCMKKNIPMSLNFVDNIAIFEMAIELNLQFPLIVDPSGLFLRFIRQKVPSGLMIEQGTPENSTLNNIISAIEHGYTMVVVDFNKDLLNMIEPVINWRYNQVVNRMYNKHYYTNTGDVKNDEDANQDSDIMVVNPVQENIDFFGGKYKVHQDFKLILILQNNSAHISKFILDKVFTINNDISSEATWCETVSDILIMTCYNSDREAAIAKYYSEKLYNEANEQFLLLSDKLKRVDFNGVMDVPVLDQLITLAESIRQKYKSQNLSSAQNIHEDQVDTTPIHRRQSIKSKEHSPFLKFPDDDQDSEDIPRKKLEKSFTFLQKHNAEFRKAVRRQGSVKTSFFHHSQSILGAQGKDTKLRRVLIKSLFLEGRNVEEYSNVFSSFPVLNDIIKRHQKLLSALYLLKSTTQVLDNDLGSAYSLSESHLLLNVSQALDVTILNGYLKNTGRLEDFQKFETMVLYNTFHQLYSMFRKDHQNLFSFCYAILMLKSTKEFPEATWTFLLYRKVALSSIHEMFIDPNKDQTWDQVSKFLIGFFDVCDNRIPQLMPFHVETSYFMKAHKLLLNVAEKGSLFERYLQPTDEKDLIKVSLEVPTRSRLRRLSDMPNSERSSLASLTPVSATRSPEASPMAAADSDVAPTIIRRREKPSLSMTPSIKSIDDNSFSPQFGLRSIQGLEIPKIASLGPNKEVDSRRYTNINFHSNMADMLSKNPYASFSQLAANNEPIRLGDSPLIPKQAYQLNFTETLEQIKDDEVMNIIPQSQTSVGIKKSVFAKRVIPAKSQGFDLEKIPVEPSSSEDKLIKLPSTSMRDSRRNSEQIKEEDFFVMTPTGSHQSPAARRALIRPNTPKDEEAVFENNLLHSLKNLVPQLVGLFNDIEKNVKKWTEFLNKSMLNFKSHDHIFPQMPNNWNNQFNAFDILAIMKCLRPDTLETFVQGFLGEVKHKSYYIIPRTNFESHARSNWYKRPTIVLFGDDYKNPTENIELLATRNRNQCFKVSLGRLPETIVFEELTKHATGGRWLVMENMHLLNAEQLPIFIKKVNSELESRNTDSSFKLWITYCQEGGSYSDFQLPEAKRASLEPFFKTCFKLYANAADTVKSRLFEFYKGSFLDYYAQLEQGLEDLDNTPTDALMQPSNKNNPISLFRKIKQYRIKLQQTEEKVDLYELFQKKLTSKDEPDITEKMELQDETIKARFTTTFLFSLIRERHKYEHSLPANLFKNDSIYVSDNDLEDLLDDVLEFTEKNMLAPFTIIEKFFSFILNYRTAPFMTFNHNNVQYLFRTFVSNNQNFAPIHVKDISYHMLKAAVSSEIQIFQCIRSFPNEDPPQLFGYNVNHEISYSYKKTKNMFNLLLRCDNSINKKEAHEKECVDLEKLILNQKHEAELEVILEEYIALKNDQATHHTESALRLVALLKKLLEFLPSPFDIRTINYFGAFQTQPIVKSSQFKDMAPALSKPLLTVTSYDAEQAAPAGSSNKRRPSIENPRDKAINEAFRTSFVNRFRGPPSSGKKSRKFSFTMIDSPKLTPGKPSLPLKQMMGVGLHGLFKSNEKLTPADSSSYSDHYKTSKAMRDVSHRSSTQRSEDKSAEQGKVNNRDVFKNLVLNEIKLCNKTLNKIRDDLEYAMRVVKGSEMVEKVHPAHQVITALMKNELPESWYNLGSLPIAHSENLIVFLKILSMKCENLRVLVKDRDCQMYPMIPLPKLFDPFFLFVGMIWSHCQQHQIPFNECELLLQKVQTRPMTQQNEVGGVYVSGFKISGGRLDEKTAKLEDEFSREFTSNLDGFMMKVRRRTKMTALPDEDPSIPIVIRQKFSEKQPVIGDLVGEYNDYMKKFMLNKVPKPPKENDKLNYSVRIPLIDPCSRLFTNYFHLNLYLYLRSTKPQEYWQMKGTCVLIQFDA